ncbi:MAG: protein kinase, partial [Ignavibacteriae bacterium]|nr:protein kinase [Ignavibacteriota bacterium]
MIEQTISHYKILEKLGEGGMGVVYKAHDTKLDRIVALKFLPQYLSTDVNEKERFYHEARAASALLHANVAVIFEVNEHEGRIFLAMEYVEGQTLKKLIEAGDPLSIKKVLDIAIQSCDGLVAAHDKGIVHRDIKSDNIMITAKGQLKIMDFGLAKVKGATKLTKAGSTLGTAAYMSPEQAQGEEVDHRSDIFSFGVVLYELLTGRLPFKGEHHAALMYSLINEEPPPVARFNEKVTQELQHIVSKALAKDKQDRYQHADDLLADLRRERKQLEYARAGYATTRSVTQTVPVAQPKKQFKKYIVLAGTLLMVIVLAAIVLFMRRGSTEAVSTEPARKMLAVLPFENLGTAEQEYFADGITEEVTSRLSGLSGLGVIARTSAMQYKKTTKTLQQIGSELGVAYVLQGTIRWGTTPEGGVRVRVNPALIKVSDATQLWSQPYDAVFS